MVSEKGVICSKHEVAFPVENTIISLDLPQEVISTLLAYLQLDKEKWIKVLPHAYTKCKVTSYKGAKHLKKVAKNVSFVYINLVNYCVIFVRYQSIITNIFNFVLIFQSMFFFFCIDH